MERTLEPPREVRQRALNVFYLDRTLLARGEYTQL